jgi:hypothetical protein
VAINTAPYGGGYFSFKVRVMNHDAELYDENRETQTEGISMPVFIERPLMETITPGPYLESLGISLEQRIINLLHLTRAMINPSDEKGNSGDVKIPFLFMMVCGPMVREDCFTITARIKKMLTIIKRLPSAGYLKQKNKGEHDISFAIFTRFRRRHALHRGSHRHRREPYWYRRGY